MSLGAISEFKNVPETQMISKLWIRLYAVNMDTSVYLWTDILFKFQCHIEKHSREPSLGPGLISTSPEQCYCNTPYKTVS